MTDFAATHESTLLYRGLVVDIRAKHLRRMRQAVWAYLYVLLAVHRLTGFRLIDPGIVAEQMGISEATVRSWLGHLRRHGYVRVERQGKLLRVAVTKWRPVKIHTEVRPRRKERPAPVVLAPLTPEALAARLAARATDPFWKDVTIRVPNAELHQLLAEVERVPESKIRKSREALFRYLIEKRHPLNEPHA